MSSSIGLNQTPSIFSKEYWREASKNMGNLRILAFAAIIIALRVIVKLVSHYQLIPPVAPGVRFSLDCYVNSIGSMIYGPVVSIAVGAISDTLGCILFPTGDYFFPFIFTEISSSLIFALFFWRRNISLGRVIAAKFTVNMVSNVILTSLIQKWMYAMMENKAFPFINGARIAKNLILFPIEAALIALLFVAVIPPLRSIKVLPADQKGILWDKQNKIKLICMLVGFFLLSVGLILFYVYFLADFISANNFKFW